MEGTITPQGGTLRFPGVGRVSFPVGSFTSPTLVRLSRTYTPTRPEGKTTWELSFGGRSVALPYDVRVETGNNPPMGPVQVDLTVPETYQGLLPAGDVPRMWARHLEGENEGLDLYRLHQSAFDPLAAIVSGTLEALDYRHLGTDADSLGAMLTLGSTPAPASGPAAAAPAQTDPCPLAKLSSPLAGDPVVTSKFGPGHSGVDYRSDGDPVLFAGDQGTVRSLGYQQTAPTAREKKLGLMVGGAGQYITVTDPDGSVTKYFHLEQGSTGDLKVGDTVRRGDVVGTSDATPPGGVTGPHLHFEYQESTGKHVDPDACVQRAPADFTGTWTGWLAGSAEPYGRQYEAWSWSLTQGGTAVTGYLTNFYGDSGPFAGTVDGNTFSFTISLSYGQWSGTATRAANGSTLEIAALGVYPWWTVQLTGTFLAGTVLPPPPYETGVAGMRTDGTDNVAAGPERLDPERCVRIGSRCAR